MAHAKAIKWWVLEKTVSEAYLVEREAGAFFVTSLIQQLLRIWSRILESNIFFQVKYILKT